MSKTTIIIDNIITPYIIARYNAINQVLEGNFEVWFQAKTDINRHWQHLPKIEFKHLFLEDIPIRLIGSDVTTFHINLSIIKLLSDKHLQLERVIICGWDSLTYWYTVWFCHHHRIWLTLWSGSTCNEKSWRRTLFLPIIKWVVKNAQDYIAYGSRAKQLLLELGATANKVKIFTNSIDVAFFSAQAARLNKQKSELKKKLGLSPTDFVFLYVGQLIKRKGISDLLKAYQIVQNKHHVSLLIIGKGSLEEELKRECHRAISPIIFLGHVEYHKLPLMYAVTDTFVLPSREEVWGLVVNEALASGVPVIVSDAAGAAPDLVIEGKNGYTYQSGDIKQLTKTMIRVVKQISRIKKYTQHMVKTNDPVALAQKVFGDKLNPAD